MTWPRSPVKQLTYLLLLLFLIGSIASNVYLIIQQPFYQTDFRSFYAATQILINQPQDLYNFETQKTYQFELIPASDPHAFRELIPFVNPPIFLLPFLMLVKLPPQHAYFVTVFINTGLLIAAHLLLIKLFPKVKYKLLLVLFILAFSQSYAALIMSQSSLLTLLIFASIYYLLKTHRWLLAGLAASLLAYKPQLGIVIIPYLFLQRRPSLAVGLLGGWLILFGLSWWLTDGHLWQIISSWLTFIDYQSTAPLDRITWLGLFSQLAEIWPHIPTKFLAIAASLVTIIWVTKRAMTIDLKSPAYPIAFSSLIVATLLSAVHAHGQETVMLLFPLYYFSQAPKFKLFIIIAVGWLVFGIYNYSRLHTGPSFIFPTLYLFALLVLISRKLSPLPGRRRDVGFQRLHKRSASTIHHPE